MKHRLMPRLSLIMAFFIMLVPLLGQSASAAIKPHASTTIIWFMRIDAKENPWEKERVAAFQKANPDIQVKLILAPNANGQFDAKFNTLLNSTPADIWSHLGQAGFADYYHRGLLLNFDPLIKQYGYTWGSTPMNLVNTYRKPDGLYGIPSITLGSYLFYNKDLFDAAHIAYPPANWNDKSWTWDKMEAIAKKLTNPAKHQYGITPGIWPPMGYAFQAGTDMFTKAAYTNGLPKSINVTDPAIVKVYQRVADWANKLKIAPAYSDQKSASNNGLDLFESGNIGMEQTGGWGFRNYNSVKFRWGAAAMPRLASNEDVLFTDPYMVYKHTKNPAAVFKFIKFLTNNDSMTSYIREVSFTPSNPDFLGLWYKLNAQRTGMTEEQLKTLVAGARANGFESPNHLIVNFSEIVNKLSNDIDPIMFGSKTAAQQLPVAQSDINNVIAMTH